MTYQVYACQAAKAMGEHASADLYAGFDMSYMTGKMEGRFFPGKPV